MNRVYRPLFKTLAGLFVAAMYAFPQATISAQPGTLNYVEGHAYVDGQEIQQKQLGRVNLQADQTLQTDENSKAEVLLTPGVFLRVGNGFTRRNCRQFRSADPPRQKLILAGGGVEKPPTRCILA